MAAKTVLILGGGWGGLTAAHQLRTILAPEHRILVVERRHRFSLYVSYLWLMTGRRESLSRVERDMARLKREGIEWVHAEALSFDPSTKTVETSEGRLSGDYVVLALGAELAPGTIPGFDEGAHNLYEGHQAADLSAALAGLSSGRVVVLVARAPFRCPAAPYEAAMLADDIFRRRRVRDDIELSLYTPEPQPMLVAGQEVGKALEGMLADKAIGYFPHHTISHIDPEARTLHFDDEAVPYDLLIGIPPHRPPALVAEAGIADASGYVPVHPQTLEILTDIDELAVGYPGVFALGDVTAVRLLNQLLLPKAGVFAEGQAHVVANAIAADIAGEPRPGVFDGHGFCYVEVGEGMAAYGSGDFYAFPEPRVTLEMPTTEAARAKEEYEKLLDLWFEE